MTRQVAPRPPMSEEQLKAFIAKAKDDQSIQDKLKSAKSPEDVVGIAKEHGHEFIADELSQLSEEELEVLAGGYKFTQITPNCNPCIESVTVLGQPGCKNIENLF